MVVCECAVYACGQYNNILQYSPTQPNMILFMIFVKHTFYCDCVTSFLVSLIILQTLVCAVVVFLLDYAAVFCMCPHDFGVFPLLYYITLQYL